MVVYKKQLGKGRENGSTFKPGCALPFSIAIKTERAFLKRLLTSFTSNVVSAVAHRLPRHRALTIFTALTTDRRFLMPLLPARPPFSASVRRQLRSENTI